MLLDEMGGIGGMSGLGDMSGLDPQMFQQLMQQYQQSQANPFTQSIPGTEYLGGGQDGGGFGGQQDALNQQNVPTDFATMTPGLPNLPQSMQGFGFGQNAPEQNENAGLREKLIGQLLNSLMTQGQGIMGGGGM